MRVLERAMRLRWLGWIIMAPGFLMAAELLVAIVAGPAFNRWDSVLALLVPLVFLAVGGTLHYLGRIGSRDVEEELDRTVPWVVAGYVRIDKNAGWIVAWLALPPAIFFSTVGVMMYGSPVPSTSEQDGMALWGFSGVLGLASAYAIARALQARRRIVLLGDAPPEPEDDEQVMNVN
jgi:hypothetical protein